MSSLTPQEQAVMDLRDLGKTANSIADELQLPKASVRRTISMYDINLAADRDHKRRMTAGSEKLCQRISELLGAS